MEGNVNWTTVYQEFGKVLEKEGLEAGDLEHYALAAYLTGKDKESFRELEHAHQSYLDQGETRKAVRCAFWLGMMFMNAGERARSGGWLAKGERLLNEKRVLGCPEEGLFLVPKGLAALSSGNGTQALKFFSMAEKAGGQFGDADLTVLGRLGHGQALVQQGEIPQGLKLLDETLVILETDKVFPIAIGIVYCAVIETFRKAWDLHRAQEWTLALSRWCQAQAGIVPFRGQCLVRQAEVLRFRGDWKNALEECENACQLLTRPPGEPAAGEAFYLKADLYRLLGNYGASEGCYLEASKWGRPPQPGLALLRLALGNGQAAATSIQNVLTEAKDIKKRAALLPAAVWIFLSIKGLDKAGEFARELSTLSGKFNSPYLHAASRFASGALAFAMEDNHKALDQLQEALKFWKKGPLPYETAQARELKGLVYQKLKDHDNAETELGAAQWIYGQLGAKPDVKRIQKTLKRRNYQNDYGLTLRELQVLQLVTTGKTNKSIGEELFISQRTVDRHVSNIFDKLSVSSRAEATTCAIRNKIIDE